MHQPILTSAAILLLLTGTAGGCRNTDQPEKKAPASTPPAKQVEPSKPAESGSDSGKPTDPQQKVPAVNTTTTATSPLITKKHTPTKPGKALIESGKLPANLQAATFGAGCFWGVESTFRKLPGVLATSVGYSGGKTQAPTYDDVCDKGTGHAEVVDVVYDPAVITYDKLLDTFFTNHNPTQVNRQGPDFGDQYRTVIFFHDDAQKAAAEKAKEALGKSGKWAAPIATQIVKFEKFWPGEDYHQTYLEKKGLDVCH
jgi:peptide-methionine (S)-S-oxide reductase